MVFCLTVLSIWDTGFILNLLHLQYIITAIREDRTRGGRSTYQCSYPLPASLTSQNSSGPTMGNGLPMQTSLRMESEEEETSEGINSTGGIAQEELMEDSSNNSQQPCSGTLNNVPLLIQVYISAHDYSSWRLFKLFAFSGNHGCRTSLVFHVIQIQ